MPSSIVLQLRQSIRRTSEAEIALIGLVLAKTKLVQKSVFVHSSKDSAEAALQLRAYLDAMEAEDPLNTVAMHIKGQRMTTALAEVWQHLESKDFHSLNYLQEAADLVDWVLSSARDHLIVPGLISKLMLAIGGRNTEIFCPYAGSLPIAIKALMENGVDEVWVTDIPSWLMAILKILCDDRIRLASEANLDSNEPAGALRSPLVNRRFDLVLAALPTGLDHGVEMPRMNERQRIYPDREMTGIKQVIDSLNPGGRAIVLSIGGLVSKSTKKYWEFKSDLVGSGELRGVIALPHVIPHSPIRPLLLELGHAVVRTHVRIVNADQERFLPSPNTPGKRLLNEVPKAYSEARSFPGLALSVPVTALQEHNFNLEPQRHVMTEYALRLKNRLEQTSNLPLASIADIIRPQSIRREDGSESTPALCYLEAGTEDVLPSGWLATPSRQVQVPYSYQNRVKLQRLMPKDILLGFKGKVGLVGLVPEAADGKQWTCNQSFVIVRLKAISPHAITPEFLFWYLRSELAQAWLATHATQHIIRTLSMRDLRDMPISVPSPEEHAEVLRTVQCHFECHAEIERIQQEIQQLHKRHWWLSQSNDLAGC